MEINSELIYGLRILAGLCCMIYVILVLMTSDTHGDRKVLKTLVSYLMVFITTFSILMLYRLDPPLYVQIVPVLFWSMLTWPVLLYKLVFELTDTTSQRRFPIIHIFIPIAYVLIWEILMTVSIPFDVRVALIEDMGRPLAEMPFLSRYYASLIAHTFVYELVYFIFCIRRLSRYYKQYPFKSTSDERYRLGWLSVVLVHSAVLIFTLAFALVVGKPDSIFIVGWNMVGNVIYLSMIFILTLNILRKNYPPGNPVRHKTQRHRVPEYVLPSRPETMAEPQEAVQPKPLRKVKFKKRDFDDFFRSEKPYLNPNFNMDTLCSRLETNRSTLSRFINRTYGLNFNAYVNRWRLQEVERLLKYKKYQDMHLEDVVKLGGFGSYDSYYRTKLAYPVKEEENE